MLNIVIVNEVYPPEPVVSAQLGRDLAVHLAQADAQVMVLCPFPTRPLGAYYPEHINNRNVMVKREEGVEVVRVPSFTSPESRLFSRMRESFSFGWHVCRYLEQHCTQIDVVYANTWPVLSQAVIARFCWRRSIPLVLHIQDVYPEVLLGKFPKFAHRLVAFPLAALDRWIARQAAQVVVISENMRRTYLEGRGIAPDKVVTVSNWGDESRFVSVPTRATACERYGISEEKFTFLYLGNIGPMAGVEGLIDAFHVAQLKQSQLVIVGDGAVKEACVGRAKRLGAKDIHFISSPDVENVPLRQSLAHVCLLPLSKGAGMNSMPSKLPSYMFSAKPVLATIDAESDTARCIRAANCGWVGEPENTRWLAAKMVEVSALPVAELEAMGQSGRVYGLRHFSKAEGVKRLGNVVLDAGNRSIK